MQQIERDCFSVTKRRSIYIYDVSISGFTRSSIYLYDISSLRVNLLENKQTGVPSVRCSPQSSEQRFRFDVSRDMPACPSVISSNEIKNDMKHWWNDMVRGTPKYSHASFNDGDTF